ncbi:FAD-dependent oxidoreductase [Cryptosporangium sp. NPDC048952]|uniref:FAD-dependent oxidoreductase n=1 Tax=Cryptosporangium sp. NPDC048952 TaxID=3363961 RepID=UPI003722CA69
MTDVLVIGAGPTGLTLALDLARRGVAVRIVDAAPGPSQASRGKGIQPRTQEVFDDLGVIDTILKTARPYPPMRAYRGDTVVWEGNLGSPRAAGPDVPYPGIVMLPQQLTEQALRDRLAQENVRVEYGTPVTDLTQDDNGVTAAGIHARYAVGADGGRSTVRKTLGIPFLGETFATERMALADVRFPDGLLDRDHWHIWGDLSTQELKLGLCPLPGTDVFQLTAPLAPDEEPEDLQRFVTERSGRDDLVITDIPWHSLYRVNIRLAAHYRKGRVFLAGDAAHAHSPAGGQGLNTGVQDAYNLGWKLAAVLAGAPEDLLDTYEAERQPVAADVLGLSTLLLRGSQEAPQRGRDTDQLDISYRDSVLSRDTRRTPGPLHAGDRAPDAPLPHGTLFERFRGPHPTVLTFRPATPLIDDIQVTTDSTGAYGSYGIDPLTGGYVVVRPDGYVGLLADADGADAVREYLRTGVDGSQYGAVP